MVSQFSRHSMSSHDFSHVDARKHISLTTIVNQRHVLQLLRKMSELVSDRSPASDWPTINSGLGTSIDENMVRVTRTENAGEKRDRRGKKQSYRLGISTTKKTTRDRCVRNDVENLKIIADALKIIARQFWLFCNFYL